MGKALDMDAMAVAYANAVPDPAAGSDLRGWSELFGVSSTAAIVSLSIDSEPIVRELVRGLETGELA